MQHGVRVACGLRYEQPLYHCASLLLPTTRKEFSETLFRRKRGHEWAAAPLQLYLYPTYHNGAFRYFQCIVIDISDHSIWQATCDDAIITNCHHDECASTSSECTIYTAPWASRSKMATLDCAGPSIVTPDTVSCACTGVHKRILIDTGCTQPHWFIRQFTAAWCECACVGTAYDALTARGW